MFGWDAGSVEDDFDIFLEPMSGGRKVFVINKQRVERRGIFLFPLVKKKCYGLIRLDGVGKLKMKIEWPRFS